MNADGKQDLLILGCSQAKKKISGVALDVYDGPIFRTLRRRLPEIDKNLAVYILSAKYGFIQSKSEIDWYDSVLGSKIDKRFVNHIQEQCTTLSNCGFGRILVLAPTNYVLHLPIDFFQSRCDRLEVFSGRTGKSQSILLEWLGVMNHKQNRESKSLGTLKRFVSECDCVQIHQAAMRLEGKTNPPQQSMHWYARVDNLQVPVKKLVSELTGVSVSTFDTGNALAFLRFHKIEVRRGGV